jgi:hypothetical protein
MNGRRHSDLGTNKRFRYTPVTQESLRTGKFRRYLYGFYPKTSGSRCESSGRLSIGLLRSRARLSAGVPHRVSGTTAHAHASALARTRRSRDRRVGRGGAEVPFVGRQPATQCALSLPLHAANPCVIY